MVRERKIDKIQINPRWLRISYGKEFWDEWISYRTSEPPAMAEKLEQWLATSDRYRGDERNTLILEAAFFLAWYRNDLRKAHVWLGRAVDSEDDSYCRIRAEVALQFANCQFSDALEYWHRGVTLLQGMSQPWIRSIEQEWLEWRVSLRSARLLVANCFLQH